MKTKHPNVEPETMRGSGLEGEVTAIALPSWQGRDDGQLTAELRLARLRAQVAIVRTLADHIEHLARWANAEELSSQLIEETARLGCRLLEVAALMTMSLRSEDSGVFARTWVP